MIEILGPTASKRLLQEIIQARRDDEEYKEDVKLATVILAAVIISSIIVVLLAMLAFAIDHKSTIQKGGQNIKTTSGYHHGLM